MSEEQHENLKQKVNWVIDDFYTKKNLKIYKSLFMERMECLKKERK